MPKPVLLKQVNSADISEAMAYERIDPIPDPWFIMGRICSTMANLWGDTSKKKWTPADFMPVKPQSHKQSPQESFTNFAAAISGRGK